MPTETIPYRLLEQGRQRANQPAYYVRRNGHWEGTTWSTYTNQVAQAGRALSALGFEPGQNTCVLGFNRPEWLIFYLATMGSGGASAGIYTTCSTSEVNYIISHTEALAVLVENENQWEKVRQERAKLPKLRYIITMDDVPAAKDDDMVLTWEEFMSEGDEESEQVFLDRVNALQSEGLATLIYTSGTTGPPKGVMLSHKALIWTAEQAINILGVNEQQSVAVIFTAFSHR